MWRISLYRNTLRQLTQMLNSRERLYSAVCFFGQGERRTTNMNTDFCGYVIPDEFVVVMGWIMPKYRQLLLSAFCTLGL